MSFRLTPLLAALALFAAPHVAQAQEWRASARVGRVTGESAPAGASGSSSAVVGLSRSAPRSWLGLSAAIPLSDDPFWAVLGGWDRLDTRGSAGLLLDLSGQGFIQRQSDGGLAPAPSPSPGPLPFPPPSTTPAPLRSDPSGQGVNGEAMAGIFARSSLLRLEARAGVAAQSSTLGGVAQDRALPTGDARVTYGLAPVSLQLESRAWLDDRITHGYVGAGLQYARGPIALWGSVGRWVSGGIDATAWTAGAGAEVAPGLMLQIGGRGNAFDPLYLSASRSSFWGGLSLRLGRPHTGIAPVAARTRDGQARIELAAREASGPPSIAGDFTGWKPLPMRREGSRWIWTGPLAPGVYHYAFVGADGTWFVPESVPGRQQDGMGGWTAVLVVS
ncbi:MAG: glycogen-binding domain-containing protein [Gemmatimonadales bacterium]